MARRKTGGSERPKQEQPTQVPAEQQEPPTRPRVIPDTTITPVDSERMMAPEEPVPAEEPPVARDLTRETGEMLNEDDIQEWQRAGSRAPKGEEQKGEEKREP